MKKNVTKTETSGNTLEIYPMEFDLDYYIFYNFNSNFTLNYYFM